MKVMKDRPLLLSAAAVFMLAGCQQEPEGEPVLRSEIGSGVVEQVAPTPSPQPNDNVAEDPAVDSDCKSVTFDGAALTHCVADPSKHRIKTVLNNGSGSPYRSLRAYADAVSNEDKSIAFAMNAGMFEKEGEPIGYYVEDKKRLVELDRDDGAGNFYMKPNGVFYGTGGKWRVTSTEWFFKTVRDRPAFGTQSGPLLVTGGKLHPEIADDGPSKAVRNGVGVDAAGKAHFVLSETPVSFGLLARFYRDELKTDNALFLDGNVSALWDPATERLDVGAPIGPILVVTKRETN